MSTFTDAQLESQRRALYKFALLKTGCPDDAEDLVQETMVRAWCARDKYDVERGPLYNWLATMLGRTWADMCESNGQPPPHHGPEASHDPWPITNEIISATQDGVDWLRVQGFSVPNFQKKLRRAHVKRSEK